MNAVTDSKTMPTRESRTTDANNARRVFAGLIFVALMAAAIAMLFDIARQKPSGRAEAALIVIVGLATLVSQSCQLPFQNVLLGTGVILAVAVVAEAIRFDSSSGPGTLSWDNFSHVVWPTPFVWLIAVLNSRGVAKLILFRRRDSHNYGFLLVGVTVLLCVAFISASQSMPLTAAGNTTPAFDHAPSLLIGAATWSLTALVILVASTPAFINKKPVRYPPDFQPLMLWTFLNLVFIAAAAVQSLWWPAVVDFGVTLVVLTIANHGAGHFRTTDA